MVRMDRIWVSDVARTVGGDLIQKLELLMALLSIAHELSLILF